VRTKHRSPQTNGVIERFYESLKYEHLYRLEIVNAWMLTEEIESFRQLFNEVRPHEALDFATPLEIYLRDPEL
jgi:putative transposase